ITKRRTFERNWKAPLRRPKTPVNAWKKRPSPQPRRQTRLFARIRTRPWESPLAWAFWSACLQQGADAIETCGHLRTAGSALHCALINAPQTSFRAAIRINHKDLKEHKDPMKNQGDSL